MMPPIPNIQVPKRLNESPSEKEGKCGREDVAHPHGPRLNESPSEKEGKCRRARSTVRVAGASMKVPPKRKGN